MQPALPVPAYCKACRALALTGYSGWNAVVPTDAIVYLHDDFVVSSDAARTHIVFEDQSAAWRTFAAGLLGLHPLLSAGGAAHTQQTAGFATTVTGT